MTYDLSRYDDFQSFVDIHPIITDETGFTPSKLNDEQNRLAGKIRVFLRGVGGVSTIYEISINLEIQQATVCTLLTKMMDIAIIGKCKNRRGGDRQNVYALMDEPVCLPKKTKIILSDDDRQRQKARWRVKYEKLKNDPVYKEKRHNKYLKRKAKGKE